ncbi:LysR substrate-binding domain-containing protein [Phytobacter diazotrophicus]|uniref:LysR family transcriptional regulator n=1 Tax=Citrobacter bitternis TaxID=1585982 RepID=A0ABW1PY09_9ENTR|nr:MULTISPECIES: LysR family transcriptional regulator [Phytobacter]MBS6737440.1 LysR family transcriptional regulator [Enterobacteriaceae bacterium]QIH63694.1 LysR family transcriptional regulator [Enterobacteriaceae bacterium A-F18]MBY6256631.1 LysR family transcriptional regulator [Phytobacter diazotrophicus]MDU4352488.1 LysR substrate-binding domain-containing protein [Phytobacter diazotrophicus]MDU7130003.1 LysR substrate-binding domain-containing protein [Enterobacteriaceae bacterium]
MPNRTLPLNAIDAFLVTARHLNLTHAAKELCLTQGAVSRKIASLEAWFGFPLFERHARGLRLSPQGSALLPELRSAFEHLQTLAAQARAQQKVVRLKAPTCAMRWLVPRLIQLEQTCPDVQVALTTTTDHGVNFKTEPYDAAIVFGTHFSAGDLLFDEALTPVMSTQLTADERLSNVTFLHPTRDKTDWSLWLAKQDSAAWVMKKNQHFDTMDLAITAAIQGLGVAIADETLVAEDIRAGRLMRPYAQSVKTGASYRLVLRDSQNNAAGLAAFRTSLLNN